MAKKLMVYASNTDQAWKILGDYAHLYGDNGGEPDGNTWLPSTGDEVPADLAKLVEDAHCGEMVDVLLATDEAMYAYLGFTPLPEGTELDEESFERMQEAADDRLSWAHYGAYGAMDSQWLFIKPED